MRSKAFIFLLFISIGAFAQIGEEEDYVTEITWGVNKNTNSGLIGGLVFKLARQKSGRLFHTYGLELLNITHPNELKRPTQAGTSYVWGKENWLYSIRLNYGREKIIFKKAPQQGVQISAIAAVGPTVGLVAPYYILNNNGSYEPFDYQKHPSPSSINGSGKILQGIGESDVKFGGNIKAGLSFEFGSFKNNVVGVELGSALEAFTQKIEIIPTQENRAVFSSFYFTLYWGTRK
ncbi:MAG: hypothetical protein RIA69_08360 [Cyclobacteriaceae bacterium]